MGASDRKFLVIDDNIENRFLLTRTLQRKYAQATVEECGELADAVRILRDGVDLVVSHRAGEVDGLDLLRELRLVSATVPVVMVSGLDRTRAALEAGATRFLNYDEWLRLGTVVDDIFATQPWAALVGALTHAIHAHTIVSFDYQGEFAAARHEVEPHLLAQMTDGEFLLRAHAAARGSHRSGFGWETYFLSRIQKLAFTERAFSPHPREPTGERQIARVLCQA